MKKGLKVPRYFTRKGENPFESVEYDLRSSVIRDASGKEIFRMDNVEVPKFWSQTATDILAQKYFRKAGVPQEDGSLGHETSIKQIVHRLAYTWRRWGEEYNYFATEEDAQAFYDELVYMLLHQIAAPNSPQWFNTGLFDVYGISGKSQGHWYVDEKTGELKASESAYERPQPHACFILSIKDDLVNPGGIMDLWVREARIFKYGSGVGTNYSNIRAKGEPLSGGGTSSGLMSFLLIGDRAAGAIKSGGTTRRAAKMVILDIDHPEILEFIRWKKEEEKKVAALVAAGYSSDYEGEAYQTVSGQNSNNSVRVPKEFLEAVEKDADWHCTARTTGEIMKTYRARFLWDEIAQAAWSSADPGVQYDTTINEWHTCPKAGKIRASNPCSEYLFIDDTACNLASINLRKFIDTDSLQFDIEGFQHAARLLTVVLEISVLMAHFPTKEVALRSYEFRTLGLGYANLGSLLMVMGIPYDSEKGRAIAGAITAIMTGTAYKTSAELASVKGPFPKYEENKEDMMRVLRNHYYATYNDKNSYEGLTIKPLGLQEKYVPEYLLNAARKVWEETLALGEKYGFRNAQTTVLAPTGTIGLLMDCDTTGVEPDFALVKFKKLAGGGYFKIVNQSVPIALKTLGYSPEEIKDITRYIIGHGTLKGAPHINIDKLLTLGFTPEDIEKIEEQLPSAFDINFVFTPWMLGPEVMERLGIEPEKYNSPSFNLLKTLGFTAKEIEEANEYICGTMMIEGAPHLKEEHYPVFDCANKNGKRGKRYIAPMGHVKMMAAVQPFITGAISKTVNLPNEATWQEIQDIYMQGWKLGLKAISIYRDGSKLSQPLSTKTEDAEEETTKNLRDLPQEELVEIIKQRLKKEPELWAKIRSLLGRRELPAKRTGFTQKAKVGGQTIFVRTGEYPDGKLGELFIDMYKEGATMRSMMNSFAVAVSIGLQYGVPLEEFVDKFAFTRFEPSGMVELHPNIKYATSLLDYVFRLLAFEYLGRTDLVHVKPTQEELQQLDAEKEMRLKRTYKEKTQPKASYVQKTVEETHYEDPNDALLSNMMGDAPACDVCGHIMVRNGTCYKCLNCGSTSGCS